MHIIVELTGIRPGKMVPPVEQTPNIKYPPFCFIPING